MELCKKKTKIRKTTLEGINTNLSNAENRGDSKDVESLKNQIKEFEEEFLQKEWDKCKNFTFLEDERPTKNFFNIESKKMGYNKIVKLNIENPNPDTKNPNTNPKKETTKQDEIRKTTKDLFQKI